VQLRCEKYIIPMK